MAPRSPALKRASQGADNASVQPLSKKLKQISLTGFFKPTVDDSVLFATKTAGDRKRVQLVHPLSQTRSSSKPRSPQAENDCDEPLAAFNAKVVKQPQGYAGKNSPASCLSSQGSAHEGSPGARTAGDQNKGRQVKSPGPSFTKCLAVLEKGALSDDAEGEKSHTLEDSVFEAVNVGSLKANPCGLQHLSNSKAEEPSNDDNARRKPVAELETADASLLSDPEPAEQNPVPLEPPPPLVSEKPPSFPTESTELRSPKHRECQPPPAKQSRGRMTKAQPHSLVEAPLSDYERLRLERMRKNNEFMHSLGLEAAASSLNGEMQGPPKPRPRPKPKPAPAPAVPLRRSSRHREPQAGSEDLEGPFSDIAASGPSAHAEPEPEPVWYDDSSVRKYTCGDKVGWSSRVPEASHDLGRLIGFRAMPGGLQDPVLARVYTMDIASAGPEGRALLAAGGHQGRIAVFPCGEADQLDERRHCMGSEEGKGRGREGEGEIEERVEVEEEGVPPREPLLSWKASRGWISHVQFLSDQFQEGASLLLSSSNDRTVVLWDLHQQQHLRGGGQPLPPRVVAQTDSLHSQGIFGMHELGLRLVTASKDRTLACSLIGPAGITRERTIQGHHEGAIRGVHFREQHVLADCGADASVCLLDLRRPEPCTHSMPNAHASEVNVVQWHPSNRNLLLSASHDPHILIHDIRSLAHPLHRLSGHLSPRIQRTKQIYRPTFVGAGKGVASPGEGSSQISLYSTESGKAISRGVVGYDATMLSTCRSLGMGASLWAASRIICQLAPMWEE